MNLLFKPATLARFWIFLPWLAVSSMSAAILTGSIGSHDPSRIINCNGTYYVYSTGGGMKYSTDRINWSSGTSPFPSGVPTSVKNLLPSNQGIWAPDVLFYNNKYYLYYAVASAAGTNCAIGLMTSPTLNTSASNYKWTDVGVVIYSADKSTRRSAIDPCPFLDTSNNLWLSWGSGYANGAGYYTNTIFISKLDNTTGLSVSPADTSGTTISTALTNEFGVVPGHIEASFVYYHNGYYYVFWNSGGCCSGSASTYTIHMARSTNVTGPYFDQIGNSTTNLGGTTFLGPKTTRNSIIGEEDGPGQIGVLSEGGIDRFTYHYYPLSGGTNGGANLGEETLIWGASGWPSAGADLATGTYKISSLNNGLVIGVNQAGTTDGTPLDQETYTGSAYQQWTANYTTNGSSADGFYTLASAGSGQVADIFQSNTSNGTLIDQWASTGGSNQKWFIEQTSEGYYRIVSHLASQGVMDVTNFSDASGTWLDERGWSNTVNQEWVVTGTSGSAPAAPAGLTATAGVGQISVSWPSVSGATQYNVKRGTTSGGPYTTSLGSPTSATFTDTGASNGVTYYYVVSAVNASGVSGKSSQASATLGGIPPPPAAPGGLTATAVSSSQINLTWTDNSTNESNFLIEESLDNATFTQVDSVAAGVTNDSITGLAASTLYYFRVRVGNAGGNSDYSNTNSATTLAPPAGLVWCGDGAGNVWDVGVTANWLTGGSLVPFTNSAPVTFDDTGSNNVPVTLSGVPQPAVIVIGAAKNYTFSGGGQIGGSGSLIKTGSGLLTINTTNTYAGGTVISNGMVIIGNIGANSAAWGSGPITLVGGAIQFNGYGGSSGTGWGGLANPLNVPAGQTGTLLLPPRWGYSQPFTSALTGGGTLNVTVDYIRDFISGDWSAFTGQINIGPRSGTGDFRVDNAAGYAGAAFYLGGGVNFYVINHNSLTLDIGALDGDAGAVVGSGNGSSTNPTFRIGAKNTTNTFGGTIVDSGVTSLIKTGTGTLILTGANTYSGGTTISGGELRVNSSGGSGTGFGAVMVASGGTLGGGGIISGATTVNSGGTLSPGNLPGALTFSNSLTLNSGSTNIFEISKSPLTNDVANIYGVLTCGGTLIVTNIGVSALGAGDSFKLFNAAGYSGAFSKVILPSLPAGLVWNANALNTAGTLSVVVATAPVIGPVLLSGTNLVFAGTGGVANANFYLLGSTDVSLPLTNWTRLLTNQFDDGGNFNFTNSIPPDAPQDFYLLQLP